jgi:predicted phage-related endonuclease
MNVERREIRDRAEWLAWRRENLGASEIASCFGLNPFKTLAKLVAQKRGIEGADDPESVMLRRGIALEDDAADEVAKLKPDWEIVKNRTYFVDRELRLAATPDFICIDPARNDPAREDFGVLQIKVVSPASFRKHWSEHDAPFYAVLQTEMEMLMSGASWGAVAPLIVGDYVFEVPQIYDVPRVASAEQRVVEAAKKFWAAFDAGEDPTIDYERDEKLIALLYPRSISGKIIDLTGDNRIKDLLTEREGLLWTIGDANKKRETIETEIKAKMGDAEIGVVDGWRLTLKEVKATVVKEYLRKAYRQIRATRITDKEESKNEKL